MDDGFPSWVFILPVLAITSQKYWYFALIPLVAYGFAWIGHFFFEKNKPATFQYPLYSLGSDFVMFWHMLTFQIGTKLEEAHKTIAAEA